MKRRWFPALLITLVLLFAFACGGQRNDSDEQESEADASEEATEMPEADLSAVSQDCLDKLEEYEAFLKEWKEFRVQYEQNKDSLFDQNMEYVDKNSSWGTDEKLVECSNDMNFLQALMKIKEENL